MGLPNGVEVKVQEHVERLLIVLWLRFRNLGLPDGVIPEDQEHGEWLPDGVTPVD